MKFKITLYIILCYLLFPINVFHAQASVNDEDTQFINSFEEDITGDGLREYIKLQGTLLTEQSKYYRNIWLDITGPFSQQWKISLNSGYDPHLTIVDLTNNQTNDLFFKSAHDEDLLQYNYQLYTIQNKKITKIALPKHDNVQFTFLNDYKFKVKTNTLKKPLMFTFSKTNKLSLDGKIYDNQGKLLIDKQFTIEPSFTFEPTLISKTKDYGLKSTQFLFGINKEVALASIETLWYYENEKWIKLQTTVNTE